MVKTIFQHLAFFHVYSGGLSSYALILIGVRFLQTHAREDACSIKELKRETPNLALFEQASSLKSVCKKLTTMRISA